MIEEAEGLRVARYLSMLQRLAGEAPAAAPAGHNNSGFIDLCEPLDEVQMTAVTKRLLLGERMRQESILKLFEWVKPILLAGGVTTRVEREAEVRVSVVGDLHGQLMDLQEVFSRVGLPSEKNLLIFNGNYV